MKYLSLQQAMLGMRVVLTEAGVLLKSPAGSAEYSRKGRCIKVTGHADYFPNHLRVKDKRTANGGRVSMTNNYMTAYKADGSVAWRIGAGPKEESPCLSIEHGYTSDELREAVEYIKHRRLTKELGKGLADLSPFTMKDGQVFIKDTAIPKVQLSRTETDPRKGYAINVGLAAQIKTSLKLSPEMEKAISEVVSAELKKNLQPGGTIWNSLRSGI
ncbi:hypothetical protein [Huaxiibacter chinensis]